MRSSDGGSEVCSSDLVTLLPLIKQLPEHLNTRARRLLRRPDPHDLDLITRVDHTLLHLPGDNSAATSDREHILDRHQERLIKITLRLRHEAVNSSHQLQHPRDRKRVVEGKRESVRVDIGGRGLIKQKKQIKQTTQKRKKE